LLRILIPIEPPESEVLIYWLDKLGFAGFTEENNGLLAYIEQNRYEEKAFYQALDNHPGLDKNRKTFRDIPHQNWNER